MARRRGEKFNKTVRALGILGAVFAIITSLCLIAFMVIDIIYPNYLIKSDARYYLVVFENQSHIISNEYYHRGARITVPESPTREPDEDEQYSYTYTFKGWDMTGDNIADLLPHYAYYPFRATAVYAVHSIKKEVPSSEPEEDSSEEDDSSSEEGSSSREWWRFW